MSDIWFIRHGESTSNAGEIAFDRHSTRLTKLGEEQARKISLDIPRAPDLVVVTPYIRTHQTAAPLLARFPGVKVEEWPLHEFSVLADDKYAGTVWSERLPRMREYWERSDPHYVDGAGAESFVEMLARVREGLARLSARDDGFTVVFGHGYILQTVRLLLAYPELTAEELLRKLAQMMRQWRIENGIIIRTRREGGALRLSGEDLTAALADVEWAD